MAYRVQWDNHETSDWQDVEDSVTEDLEAAKRMADRLQIEDEGKPIVYAVRNDETDQFEYVPKDEGVGI